MCKAISYTIFRKGIRKYKTALHKYPFDRPLVHFLIIAVGIFWPRRFFWQILSLYLNTLQKWKLFNCNIHCKNAYKYWLGHDKLAIAMANGNFAMEKHLAMSEDISHGQPFFIILQWKFFHGYFFKISTKIYKFTFIWNMCLCNIWNKNLKLFSFSLWQNLAMARKSPKQLLYLTVAHYQNKK